MNEGVAEKVFFVPAVVRCRVCKARETKLFAAHYRVKKAGMFGEHKVLRYGARHGEYPYLVGDARVCCGQPRSIVVIKARKTEAPCDARCFNATGFTCECACGGHNHGKGA